ncbi:hypothetical protein D3C76_1177140 [compost metagenome]
MLMRVAPSCRLSSAYRSPNSAATPGPAMARRIDSAMSNTSVVLPSAFTVWVKIRVMAWEAPCCWMIRVGGLLGSKVWPSLSRSVRVN